MNKNEEVEVYICKTDFDYHIPDDCHGIRVFFSLEDIKRDKKCAEECGVVKCKLSFLEQCTFGKKEAK